MLTDVPKFFGVRTPGELTWAHGVNSHRTLARYVAAPDTHIIEGDISLLPQAGGVMMAHPPATDSDLPFDTWIESIAAGGKGAKLDFKDPRVVKPCLAKLVEMRRAGGLPIPIVLNADVCSGPGGRAPLFDGRSFVSQCGDFTGAVLSLGYTTQHVPDGRYEEAMVRDMLVLGQPAIGRLTICLRACFLSASTAAIAYVFSTPNCWVTVWNGRWDPAVTLAEAQAVTDPARTFYDLIDADGRPIRA